MLQALIGPVTGLLDKFIEDKDQKAKLAHEIATMAEKQMHEANMGQKIPELPTFDMDSLMTVLLGMLGLGGLRTVEKVKGITK